MTDAARIAAALGARRTGGGWIARCPAHRDRRPSLSIGTGRDGQFLAHCFSGCTFEAVAAALRAMGIEPGDGPAAAWHGARRPPPHRPATVAAAPSEDIEDEPRSAAARALWAAAVPAPGTLAERYLRGRAIRACPATLRFAPALRHPTGVAAPAMLAPVMDIRGRVTGVHRTWLEEPGRKARLDPPRAMLGRCGGCAVRLSTGDGPLVVVEGVETALSLFDALAAERPRLWAALSTSGVMGLELPADPGDLVIAPDGDDPGAQAADALAARALSLGWRVRLLRPPPGLDWNDVARREA